MEQNAYNVSRVPVRLAVHPSQEPWPCEDAPGDVRVRRRLKQIGTLFFSIAWVAALVGCGLPITKTVRLNKAHTFSAVLMYPVGFRWPEPLYRSFDVSELLVRTAIEHTPDRVVFFNPTEFRIFRMDEDNVWAASDALLGVREAAIPPEAVLVFRPWVEKRVATSQKEVMASRGKNAGIVQAEETVYVAHLEVIHPSTQKMLIELAMEASADPFAVNTQEGDPTPEATVLLQQLVREAMKMVQTHTKRHDFKGWPKHHFAPETYLQKADDAEQSLQMRYASVDILEVELLKLSRLQFFNSDAQEFELNMLSRSPGGIVLRQKRPPFNDGDLIQTINGRPANTALFHRVLWGLGKSVVEGKSKEGTPFTLSIQ